MPLNHSRMSDEWLAAVVRGNPIRIAEKTGNIITCPVRLQYVNLFKPAKPNKDDAADKKPTFNCVACLPPGVDQGIHNIIRAYVYQEERKEFPNNFGPDGRSFGLHDPLRDQREKMRTREGKEVEGFTAGLLCFTAGTKIKPNVTDVAGNPIVDESRVYPGVWAILALNVYAYKNKIMGVNLGLQNVMIFADDTRTGGGGGTDPKDDFAGVQIDQAYNPAAAFGSSPPPQHAYPPPASVLPPSQPVYAPPQHQVYAPLPPPPQQGWQAPAAEPETFW